MVKFLKTSIDKNKIFLYTFLLQLLFFSCNKENSHIAKIKNEAAINPGSIKSSEFKDDTQFSDSSKAIYGDAIETRLDEHKILLSESILDHIPTEEIITEDDFQGIYENGRKVGSFIDERGLMYEGVIINTERSWRPIQGEGKIIYPDQVVFVSNFEEFCDGTSWGATGKLYFPNGDYFVGCLKWYDRKLMTGTLYEGEQQYTYIDGRKIPR